MERYTANYAYTNHNFAIQNLAGTRNERNKYYPALCVLKNIIQRGCPTLMSDYLKDNIGDIKLDYKSRERIVLINHTAPKWLTTIKGDEDNNNIPAKYFFEECIPMYLGEYKFIQQLILPEVQFNEIVEENTKEFVNQQVDFYLPQAKLVIEIDGQQHKADDVTRVNDSYRDKYLSKHGILTVRIDTYDIYNKSPKFDKKMKEIKSRLCEHTNILKYYEKMVDNPDAYQNNHIKLSLKATAAIRFQLLVLELLQRNKMNLNDSVWKFNILERDINGFAKYAIEDLLIWLQNLTKLMNLTFSSPKVEIAYCENENEFIYDDHTINVDFSILKRWTDENQQYPKVYFVRTDYFDKANYFKVSKTDTIKYKIVQDGEESAIPYLEFILKNIIGFDSFRDGQLPIIINALSCKDTIGLLPTGSGKSICYQLAALLQPCISYVVCPIKSLMYDQKDNLDKNFITHTNYLLSDQSGEEKDKICNDFGKGKYQIIWISPERFQSDKFRKFLTKLNKEQTLAYGVIDEVHCLSEWGHDFRTSYLNLIKTIRNFTPSTTLLGLTATASSFVLQDLKVEFEIGSENIKTLKEFTRPELNFYVKKDERNSKEDKKNLLYKMIKEINEKENAFIENGEETKSGLIFTLFVNGKEGCYQIANEIKTKININTEWYSGGIPKIKNIPIMNNDELSKYKNKVQNNYKDNKIPMLVATKAFGMGIDKKNIRYTFHYGIPSSLEALYQEAGRAGRDKQEANCYVLYTKETIPKEELDKLFHLNTDIEVIKEIQQKYKGKGKDILNNFFLWLSNNKGVKQEFKITKEIFDTYASPKKVTCIKCRELNWQFGEVQKAIYRLSVIGIVDDWIIESWNKGHEIIKVYFKAYNITSVIEELKTYIKRYDKEFEIDENLINDETIYENAIKLLLEWSYDNIVYNRRQSMKTIYEKCENYNSSKKFKEELESYFKYNEKSYLLDHIAQHPKDYDSWFEVFYNSDKNISNTDINAELINKKELKDLRGSLGRVLESYRYNTGLNYISGIIRLMLNEFENQDGRTRLESALTQIRSYDETEKSGILHKTLELSKLIDDKNKLELSKLLCANYKQNLTDIYTVLNDEYSLEKVLKDAITRMRKIGGSLI